MKFRTNSKVITRSSWAAIFTAAVAGSPIHTVVDFGSLSASEERSRAARQNSPDIVIEEALVFAGEGTAAPRISGILIAPDGGPIRLGQLVEEGEMLGVIDDAIAKRQRSLRELELKVAEATLEVAQTEYQESLQVVKRAPGMISKTQLERQRLTVVRSQHDVQMAAVQSEIANIKVQRHRVVAPRGGTIVRVDVAPGEWVKKGKSVARVVDLQDLWIQGSFKVKPGAATAATAGLLNKPVTFQLGQNQILAEGQVAFISPGLQGESERRIVARVLKREAGSRSQLVPGMKGSMTIRLGE